MHEMSIVNHLFLLIRQKMEKLYKKIYPVKKVKVKVGKMSTVVPRALSFAFEVLSKNTEFENTVFKIDYIPLTIECLDCHRKMELDEPFLFCRCCDSFNVEIITGRELEIDSFEIQEDETNKGVENGN
ncbi:MAG: hydrogenase maturation nickel metallochaperone HypA [Vulcanimicrobiota bacterium]